MLKKDKRVLITGVTGFVGSCLARYLIKNNFSNVNTIIRENSNRWRIRDIEDKLKIYKCDLLENSKLSKIISEIKPEVIFHLATYGSFIKIQNDTGQIYKTNLFGLINLLNACAKVDFELFVNTGSSSEYGKKNKSMKETDLLEPYNDYGISKASATLYCQNFSLKNKLQIVTLRLFSPYGYYDDKQRLIPYLILSCLNHNNPIILKPTAVRDYVFIEDVVNSYIKTMDLKNIYGQIFNIGSGKQYVIKEVFENISSLFKTEVKPEFYCNNDLDDESPVWISDNQKANEVLGWYPDNNLNQGLEKSIDWFKQNSNLYR